MFSGKSDDLIRRLARARDRGKRVRGAKPSFDADPRWLVSLAGPRWPAEPVDTDDELHALATDVDVLGVDEVQFFGDRIVRVAEAVTAAGTRLICAGLDLDFRGMAFGAVPLLAERAEVITRRTAICARCGGLATHSQRLIDGLPAPPDSPTVQIGGRELYEPRCKRCHQGPIDGSTGASRTAIGITSAIHSNATSRAWKTPR